MEKNEAYPRRYDRNHQAISKEEQAMLAASKVAVVGCGGLGGFMAEELGRLGVGGLILIDGDRHEESNLNRQLTATEQTLGQFKVHAAKARLEQVNSSVIVAAHNVFLTSENATSLLADANVVMDALDSVSPRLTLEKTCHELGKPLVFAAIDGWYGMLGVSCPGDNHVAFLYGKAPEKIESALGNPVFTPAVVASLAVAEALKLLTGRPTALQKSFLNIDLRYMEFTKFRFR